MPLRSHGLLDQLPPPGCPRWTAVRKASVVVAVARGAISAPDVRARYGLSPEELMSWMRRYDGGGVPGLRVTHRAPLSQAGAQMAAAD